MNVPKYRRILLKLSGEALLGEAAYGVDPAVLKRLATEISDLYVARGGPVQLTEKSNLSPQFHSIGLP